MRWVILLWLGAGFGALGTGCGCDSGPDAARTNYGDMDDGRSVSALVGQEFVIELTTVGPGSYETPVLTGSSVVFVREAPADPSVQTPGGPTQDFGFEVVGPGVTDITIPHTSEGPGPGSEAFEMSVDAG